MRLYHKSAEKYQEDDNGTRAQALEAARDHIYESFELLAKRDDVPDALVLSIQAAYRAVREQETATPTPTED